jgi:hypothetical protein
MARPSADVIVSCQVSDVLAIDILSTTGLWVILYQGQAFSIRQRYWCMQGESPKYIRTVFPHKSSAENLAKKLNEHFNSTEFTVTKLL